MTDVTLVSDSLVKVRFRESPSPHRPRARLALAPAADHPRLRPSPPGEPGPAPQRSTAGRRSLLGPRSTPRCVRVATSPANYFGTPRPHSSRRQSHVAHRRRAGPARHLSAPRLGADFRSSRAPDRRGIAILIQRINPNTRVGSRSGAMLYARSSLWAKLLTFTSSYRAIQNLEHAAPVYRSAIRAERYVDANFFVIMLRNQSPLKLRISPPRYRYDFVKMPFYHASQAVKCFLAHSCGTGIINLQVTSCTCRFIVMALWFKDNISFPATVSGLREASTTLRRSNYARGARRRAELRIEAGFEPASILLHMGRAAPVAVAHRPPRS